MSKKWFRREKEKMRELGVDPTIMSGAGWLSKEDGSTSVVDNGVGSLIVQLKSTDGKGIRIDRPVLNTLMKHAIMSSSLPVLVLDFVDDDMWVSVRPQDFLQVAKVFDKLWDGKYESETSDLAKDIMGSVYGEEED